MVQVHYDEGAVTDIGPEPSVHAREGLGEASVGGRIGQSLSREREAFSSATDFLVSPLLPCNLLLSPTSTGVELHKNLIDAGMRSPTILVTAYPDEVIRNRAPKNGVVCYLSKPVDDEHLERCLRSALQTGKPSE